MKLKDVMTKHVETVTPHASLQEVAQKMKSLDVGPIPVAEGDHVLGIVTDRDIVLRAVAEGRDPKTVKASDVMTPHVVYGYEDDNVKEAAKLMQDRQIRRLLVMSRDNKLVGIVSLGDLAEDAGGKISGEILKGVSEPSKPK